MVAPVNWYLSEQMKTTNLILVFTKGTLHVLSLSLRNFLM